MNIRCRIMTSREKFEELLYEVDENALIFDGFDDAIIGYTEDFRAVYQFDKMVDWLVEHDHMSPMDALEWLEYNTIRALPPAR